MSIVPLDKNEIEKIIRIVSSLQVHYEYLFPKRLLIYLMKESVEIVRAANIMILNMPIQST